MGGRKRGGGGVVEHMFTPYVAHGVKKTLGIQYHSIGTGTAWIKDVKCHSMGGGAV